MVAKNDKTREDGTRVKVGKLGVKKETVKVLADDDAKAVRGGAYTQQVPTRVCNSYIATC